MACRMVGAKPLSKPMLTYCQWEPKEPISMKFYLKFKYFHSRKCVWTYRLLNHLSLRWSHKWCDGVSNHQPHDCLLKTLFGRRSKKRSKFRVTGLCAGNSPGTGEFLAQMACNAENVSIWWRHHVIKIPILRTEFIHSPLKLGHGWVITSSCFMWM